ncbi:MAG: hypothetical protein KBD10_00345 [Candidatus Pacebacteria bacterium]|jgi:hypothetical protein|nr:hypothetical protein [Candidatus Paceibacterota bacterium]
MIHPNIATNVSAKDMKDFTRFLTDIEREIDRKIAENCPIETDEITTIRIPLDSLTKRAGFFEEKSQYICEEIKRKYSPHWKIFTMCFNNGKPSLNSKLQDSEPCDLIQKFVIEIKP